MLRINQKALTFDDVLLIPNYSEILPNNVNLKTSITRLIELNIPLVSAAMDTVTESRLAISMAQEGGIGIIHKNMTIDQQSIEVRKVKKHETAIVRNPVTISPYTKIMQLLKIANECGFSSFPVIQDDKLVGIVTGRDLRANPNMNDPVTAIMTPKNKLIIAYEGTSLDVIKAKLYENRIEKMLLIDSDFSLTGLVTFRDIEKSKTYPFSSKDENGCLLVGAAIGTGSDNNSRVHALVSAGVDVIVIDTAHGHSKMVINTIKVLKKMYPQIQVIGGNIATADAAIALINAGADAVKIGIGPGSICTTRIVTGVGVPQISAIANIAEAIKYSGVPLIADGGIRFSGDLAKAIAAGAHCVMIGSMFAGTAEAPGDIELFQGRSYKSYRGMGSLGAMAKPNGASDRYFQNISASSEKLVPEGIEGRVPYKGSLSCIIFQLIGGLRAAMGYTGSFNINDMRTNPNFVQVTPAGMTESHVHDVNITKEAPNYMIRKEID